MTGFKPTDEQVHIVDLALTGEHMAIDAGSGCGKTRSLMLIADAKSKAGSGKGVYVAFNRRVVDDAQGVFPQSVNCATAHGLAMRAIGRQYRHRLGGRRMKSSDIARMAGIGPMTINTPYGSKRLAPGFLAGILMRSVNRFCQTADLSPTFEHVVTPQTMRDDRDLMREWTHVRRALEPALRKAWADTQEPNGVLPFSHDAYLKIWSLSNPRLDCDYLLSDEGQDLWPSWLSIMEQQRNSTQLVIVGDENQELYAWRSSVNAMRVTEVTHRAQLTASFRFGPEIAEVANQVLVSLGSPLRIRGAGPPGRVGPVAFPDMVLSRTNAVAVRRALEEMDQGGKPHIVGGATEVVSFARGALDLQKDGWSYHPDLCCFGSWSEVQDYVDQDELGGELALLVNLVDDFTAKRIVDAFQSMPARDGASLVVSTVHKMKGGEAASVKLAEDFPEDDPTRPVSDEERRVCYVAVTRAQRELDIESVGLLRKPAPRVAL